jgi:two-component system OmpR family sensor kinase
VFRSLAARLTATYVFAAIVLVVIVIAAVTTFALSMFGIATREATEAVARQVPEEYRLEVSRGHSLDQAAHALAQHLARPGIRIVIFALDGHHRRFLAAAPDDVPRFDGPGRFGPPPDANAGLPPFANAGPPERPRPFPSDAASNDRMRPFPFALNFLLRLEPRNVAIPFGRVTILPDPAPLVQAINAFWLAMIPIGLFVVGAAWLLGRYITGQALRPLAETTASLNRFGAGDFTPRAIVTIERNEIGELARAYNAAAAQVSAAFEERRAAESQMRQFIADAGHELRTPLTVIMGFIDVLRRRSQGDGGISLRIYETMLEESRRMRTLIDKLILLARLENPHERELETVDLAQVAAQAVSALQALDAKPRIALESSSDVLVRGYEREIYDALANLVENALKYAPDSPVEVRVRVENGEALVDVSDRGPGIPSDEQSRIFDRFYRGRDHGDAEGFGLGLAIAKRAVERAGGRLSVFSVPGEGSRFTLTIPLATRGEAATLAV